MDYASKFAIINVYATPTEDTEPKLDELQTHLEHLKKVDTILIGDFNAKSHVWGDILDNDRGTVSLEFCASNDLVIFNYPNSTPTFQGRMGQSWVYLKMIRFTNRNSKITECEFSEENPLSNHNEIGFNYVTYKITLEETETRYKLNKLN